MFSTVFVVINYLALSLGGICLLLAGNYLYTSIRFRLDLKRFQNANSGQALPAPKIPFLLPWIGIAPSFLTTKPLAFWKRLFQWYPRGAGSCTLTMGGETAHVVFNAPATQYIMKDRKLGREKFTEIVITNGFGLSAEEYEKYFGFKTPLKPGEISSSAQQEKTNVEYLLKTDHVNELTAHFLETMRAQIADQFESGSGEVQLYAWLRHLMFVASTTAGWGDRILKVIPNLEEMFFQYDRDMLTFFYGLPRWLIPKKIANRDRIRNELARWYEIAEKETGGVIPDPATVSWDPIYGSRISRARHLHGRQRGVSPRTIAGMELGFLFGLSSNAIPATAWMLFHILDSETDERSALYAQIMSEIEASKIDGTINVSLLVTQPIFLSTLHETLRLYVDTLITREIPHDMTLPLTPEKSEKPRHVQLKAKNLLMIPTYPAHTDPETWQSAEFPHHPPPDTFYAYRFLTCDPTESKEKPVFTTAHTVGKFFPFGGGKTICPGRIFAKQEIMAGVAVILDTFDIELIGYVDGKGKSTHKFPVLADSLPGSALMVPGGDMKVRIERRAV